MKIQDENGRMSKTTTPKPNDWREARRLRAWELKQKGWKQTTIADALGVSNGAVSQWLSRAERGGLEALRTRQGGGPKPRLNDSQQARLPELLRAGAEAYGFRGQVWTRARVQAVIEQQFGVRYSLMQIGRLLKQLGWSRQKPVERASQRNEAAIAEWRERGWAELKKSAGRGKDGGVRR